PVPRSRSEATPGTALHEVSIRSMPETDLVSEWPATYPRRGEPPRLATDHGPAASSPPQQGGRLEHRALRTPHRRRTGHRGTPDVRVRPRPPRLSVERSRATARPHRPRTRA